MIDNLQTLIRRTRAELQADAGEQSVDDERRLRQSLVSLLLAESAYKKITLTKNYPEHPPQLVVVGPTQVGKSSLVNVFLNRNAAVASSMAGHTVHCQGFSLANTEDEKWLMEYFQHFEQRQQSALDRQIHNEYSLSYIDSGLVEADRPKALQGAHDKLIKCVLWDTPDFDSVESMSYRTPVLRAIALADLLVFVVSKEKYADNTVWTMLRLVSELDIPVVLVMNKTPPEVRDELAKSVWAKYQRIVAQDKVRENGDVDAPALIFIDEYPQGDLYRNLADEREVLLAAVSDKLHRRDTQAMQSAFSGYCHKHWSQWTESLSNEHRLQGEWKILVDETMEGLVERYTTEYLEHNRYRETFQLALAELLTLLEVPGMAESLTKIRSVVTWPMRKLIAAASESREKSDQPKDDRSEERRLLEELAEHGLSTLARHTAVKQTDVDWWSALNAELDSRESDLLDGYHKGLDNYQTLLNVEIERAAQKLYRNLQQQPATLNSLRAARVTTDAAAVVLAVKSGGLGAADLVIAPAMLSLTSMLTEGALGQYMQKVQNDLKKYQEKEVASLIARKLRHKLYPLGEPANNDRTMSAAELQRARVALTQITHQNASDSDV